MSDSNNDPVVVKAPPRTKADELLEEGFYKDFAGQAERLDKFALELIKLQLAVPTLYAGILKLLEWQGPVATDTPSLSSASHTSLLLWIFIPWFFALVFSFCAVFPMGRYQVKSSPIVEPLPERATGDISIYAYFHFAARRKFRLLAGSALFTFFGIAVAVFGHM